SKVSNPIRVVRLDRLVVSLPHLLKRGSLIQAEDSEGGQYLRRGLPPRPLRWVGLLPLVAWEHHKHHRRACGLDGFVFALARRTSGSSGLRERQTESQSCVADEAGKREYLGLLL